LEWYQIIFEMIDMRSFSNLWYWIALAVLWSTASHWVLGVPFDLITRARQMGGDAQQDLETLVRINVARLLFIARTSGTWVIGLAFFMVSVLLMLGFYYGIEFAQALTFFVVPMAILSGLSVRSARIIEAGENEGAALHRRLSRHRISIQFLGMLSILVTSMFGMYQNLQIGVLG